MATQSRNRYKNWAILISGCLFVGLVLLTNQPQGQWLLAPGEMNTGHESLKCTDCHRDAPGTLRRQLQANFQYLLKQRSESVYVGHIPVGNQQCLNCHSRPKDNHPVYRFLEPRFKKARQQLAPHQCISCHLEHQGKRVTSPPNQCKVCHEKLSLKKDPITPSHRLLTSRGRFLTCLQCHDYHGNHKMKITDNLKRAHLIKDIKLYLNGGDTPYSDQKYFKAKKNLDA